MRRRKSKRVLLQGVVPVRDVPRNLEAERAVLGAVLVCPRVLDEHDGEFDHRWFYWKPHQVLLAEVVEMHKERAVIDLVTVCERLERAGKLEEVGGRAYVSELVTHACLESSVGYYLKIVRDHAVRRDVLGVGYELLDMPYDSNISVEEMLSRAESLVRQVELACGMDDGNVRGVGDVGEDVVARILRMRRDKFIGYSSGYRALDAVLRGIRVGSLVVIAARPSVGKTALALNMAWRQACLGIPVGVLTLEMTVEDIVERLVQGVGRLTAQQLMYGDPGRDERLERVLSQMVGKRLFLSECCRGRTTDHVCAELRRLALRHGCKVVYVDYFNEIEEPGYPAGSRVEMYAAALKRLSDLRGELVVDGVPLTLVINAQLNREADRDPGRPTRLRYLADTGNIERVADVVLFLHDPSLSDGEDAGAGVSNVLEVGVMKNRYGQAYPAGGEKMWRRLAYRRDIQLITDIAAEVSGDGFSGDGVSGVSGDAKREEALLDVPY